MQIRMISVMEENGQVRARLMASAQIIGVKLWLEVCFRTPENSNRDDWMQEAYNRSLSVLDPA